MTAVNHAPGAPDSTLYAPFQSKSELMQTIRDSLVGVDQSRLQDLLLRLSATLTSVWPDADFISS